MAKWSVELCCGIGFTVSGVEADTRTEAIEKAKQMVLDGTTILTGKQVEENGLEYDRTAYIQMEGD